ncbi:Arc family DNA-binding protein [Stutzerimonas degradans]|nr:Arc family DNA-binding protein [Stutzerimonas degradans]
MNDWVRVTTRLPKEVAAWLKTVGKDQSRSMNGQLIEVVKKAMREEQTVA